MPSVALIGPDGAGKTTVTRMLLDSGVAPFKYLYMGIDVPASNIALPTTRLVERLKPAVQRERAAGTERPDRLAGPPRKGGRRSTLWAFARVTNRLLDEWYRQCVSWHHQLRGFTVLYDRHFAFDFSREVSGDDVEPFDRKVHRWFLEHLYPQPDLVIFLDAPGAVLFARKGELTVEELERRRQGFLRRGRGLKNFVCVDATRALDVVYAEVAALVLSLSAPVSANGEGAGRETVV